jgi:hypothetical protein
MFKIKIENTVQVPVKFTMKEGETDKVIKFSFTAKRMPWKEINESEKSVTEFLLDNVTGWKDQSFVLMDDGEPAPFSADALRFMLDQIGLISVMWNAYLRECGGKEKN